MITIEGTMGLGVKCTHCGKKATWTIRLTGYLLHLCDECCDDLSRVAGDAKGSHAAMDSIPAIVATWRAGNNV